MDWGYVCGFMDGEGWISFHERTDKRGNTNLDHNIGCCQSTPQDRCLREIAIFLESEGIESKIHIARNNGPRRHPVSKLYIQGNRDNKIKFLQQIVKGCHVKNIKAAALIEEFARRPIRNTQFYPKVRDRRCAQALEFYSTGVSMREAAKKYGIAVVTLTNYAAANNIALRTMSESGKLAHAMGKKPYKPRPKVTHCRRGHAFLDGSYRMNGMGGRICLECRRQYVALKRKI